MESGRKRLHTREGEGTGNNGNEAMMSISVFSQRHVRCKNMLGFSVSSSMCSAGYNHESCDCSFGFYNSLWRSMTRIAIRTSAHVSLQQCQPCWRPCPHATLSAATGTRRDGTWVALRLAYALEASQVRFAVSASASPYDISPLRCIAFIWYCSTLPDEAFQGIKIHKTSQSTV